jgi:hypothetical protein
MNPAPLIMKFTTSTSSLARFVLVCLCSLLAAAPGAPLSTDLFAADISGGNLTALVRTNESTLNDLIRRIPIQSRMRERELAGLSAAQEQVLVHERRMCGEGLPLAQRQQFAASYSLIVSAIVDERISRRDGRALLDGHRALIERAYQWASLAKPDPAFGDNLNESLETLRQLVYQKSVPLGERSPAALTPLVNGQLLWIEEMLIWGGQCRFISIGELGKIGRLAQRLERFEGYYKRDGILTTRERSELHRRMIEIHRTTIESFAS